MEGVWQFSAAIVTVHLLIILPNRVELSKHVFKMEFIRKLSKFSFQWTKPCTRIISIIITFFFALFKGYKCNKFMK